LANAWVDQQGPPIHQYLERSNPWYRVVTGQLGSLK
jgi:hypothetical protein